MDDYIDPGSEPYIEQLPPVVIPLVYDDTLVMTSIQRVLFVHSAASSLQTYANGTTFAIIYDYSSTLEEVLELIRRKFPASITRIGFAFHNNGDLTSFLNRETWFSSEESPSRNVQFMLDFIREFRVTNVDFLACKTLQSEKWKGFFQLLRDQTNVVVGASENDTGNMKYGGDWVMESTMEDIRDVYFTPEVVNWASLLVVNSTIVVNLANAAKAMCISGDFMYVGVGFTIQRIDLTTNTVTQVYAHSQYVTALLAVGNYLYFNRGETSVGRIDLTTGTFTHWSGGIWGGSPFNGFASDGTYLYSASNTSICRVALNTTLPGLAIIFVKTGNTTAQWNPPYMNPSPTGRPLIRGSYMYVPVGGNKINQYELSTGTLLNSYLSTSGLSYLSSMVEFNTKIYIAQNVATQCGIFEIGADWTILNSSYFVNPNSIYDMVVYKNKLYCTTNTTGTVISIPLTATPSSNVNFVLTALNSSIQLSTSSVIPNYLPSISADAIITLNTRVPASVLQNTFFFRTDKDITMDASFVYYYVDTNKWPNKNTTLSARNGMVTSNGYVTNDSGGKDFLRDIARQLFGTYLGADLFTNEDAVVSDINSKFDTVADNIIALLFSIDKTNGVFPGITSDLSGNKYLKDDTSNTNISRELLNEIMTAAPNRLIDIKTNYKYNATEDGLYKMPILTGDSIAFKVTITPASDQTTRVPTLPGTPQMLSRSYQVILNVS